MATSARQHSACQQLILTDLTNEILENIMAFLVPALVDRIWQAPSSNREAMEQSLHGWKEDLQNARLVCQKFASLKTPQQGLFHTLYIFGTEASRMRLRDLSLQISTATLVKRLEFISCGGTVSYLEGQGPHPVSRRESKHARHRLVQTLDTVARSLKRLKNVRSYQFVSVRAAAIDNTLLSAYPTDLARPNCEELLDACGSYYFTRDCPRSYQHDCFRGERFLREIWNVISDLEFAPEQISYATEVDLCPNCENEPWKRMDLSNVKRMHVGLFGNKATMPIELVRNFLKSPSNLEELSLSPGGAISLLTSLKREAALQPNLKRFAIYSSYPLDVPNLLGLLSIFSNLKRLVLVESAFRAAYAGEHMFNLLSILRKRAALLEISGFRIVILKENSQLHVHEYDLDEEDCKRVQDFVAGDIEWDLHLDKYFGVSKA